MLRGVLLAMIVDPTEREDFYALIKRAGHSEADFELFEQEERWSGLSGSVQGKVKIKNVKTGIERDYEAGSGTSWPAKFYDDLISGAFE